jgi:hypothetical protein
MTIKTWVIIPDLQVPYQDKPAVEALAKFIKAYKPTGVACVGDEIDFQGISKWSVGTELEWDSDIGKDRDETVAVMKKLQVTDIVRSNHRDRLYNKIRFSAPGLRKLPELEIGNFMKYAELGIKDHGEVMNIAPGWILMHGDQGNIQPTAGATALGLAKRSGMSVICGHTHRAGLTHYTTGVAGQTKTIWGLEVGHLMNLSGARYIKAGLFTWSQSFAILKVDGNNVYPKLVPIVNKSFIVEGKVYSW